MRKQKKSLFVKMYQALNKNKKEARMLLLNLTTEPTKLYMVLMLQYSHDSAYESLNGTNKENMSANP